jgi:hypothetical protein
VSSYRSSDSCCVSRLHRRVSHAYLRVILSIANPAAAEVDLFSFDDAPSTSTPAPAADSSFDAFQTAPVPAANDDFGDFQQIAPSSAVQFDAFGSSPAPAQQQTGFVAFGATSQSIDTMQQMPMGGGSGQLNAMNDVFGNMSLQSQQMSTAPAPVAAAPVADNGDDFGDFEDAEPSAAKSPVKSLDPLSKLISLDGLTKNPKKEEKSSEPVGSNDTADPFGQNQQTNPQMGFSNNITGFGAGVMAAGGNVGIDNISLMAPQGMGGQMMGQPNPNQQQQMGGQMMGQPNPNQQQMAGGMGFGGGMSQQQMYQMQMMRQQQMMGMQTNQGNMNQMGQQGMMNGGMGNMGMQPNQGMMNNMGNNNMSNMMGGQSGHGFGQFQ